MFNLFGPDVPSHVAHFNDDGSGNPRDLPGFFRALPSPGTSVSVRIDSGVVDDSFALGIDDFPDAAHSTLRFLVVKVELRIRHFSTVDPKGEERRREVQVFDVFLERTPVVKAECGA